MRYQQIKAERERKQSELHKTFGLFFAFSHTQFYEAMQPLEPGDKYVHLAHGAYMPKSKVDDFLNAMEALNKWEREQITGAKLEEEQIREELSNHEAFYSHDIDSTCAALPMYSRERIAKVYYKNLKKCSHV